MKIIKSIALAGATLLVGIAVAAAPSQADVAGPCVAEPQAQQREADKTSGFGHEKARLLIVHTLNHHGDVRWPRHKQFDLEVFGR